MSEFRWTDKSSAAAVGLAAGKSHREVSEEVDISERQITRWKQHPEFVAEVDRLTLMVGIATRAERLRIVQRIVRQRISEEGGVISKADLLDWLKFAQSETTGAVDDLADRIAALMADRPSAS